ncbi:MAG TPA: polysaccharide biosynthesis C-terminal domain-containing protein [Chitinophagaceae bacterium]|nr:polysaccharide biosynthesis C-terminal domain-containing protein [Chitinophagaceae bacterium]
MFILYFYFLLKFLMGIIQKQSIRSTIGISIGFAIGAFNMLVLAPKVLSTEQLGLTRLITDLGITLATLCTFGSLPVIYKFFPFYKSHLPPKKNELPFLTLSVCCAGFIIMCTAGYVFRGLIIQKFSAKSPLFVQYSYFVYPFCLFYLLFLWLESFSWSYKKGVLSNTLREMAPRVLFSVLLLLMAFRVISLQVFLVAFALSYLLPAVVLFRNLQQTGEFTFTRVISSLTRRLKGKMINFGLFLFGAQFLNLLSKTADTFIISSKAGLAYTAVFTIATYVVTLMEIPQRSITSISIPVLSESWKNKDLGSIKNIYTKSVANLLIIGLSMFCLILLNVHNLASYLGRDYKGIEMVVFFLGLSKLIDLGTGANAQIIATSNYWKVDFTTNVLYTIIALPLNYVLISHFGLMGAAYSTLIAISFYNAMRFGFLWIKFGLQPYTGKDLLAIIYAAAAAFACYYIPHLSNIFLDAFIRTMAFCALFFPAVYFTGVSAEVNELMKKYVISVKNIIFRK